MKRPSKKTLGIGGTGILIAGQLAGIVNAGKLDIMHDSTQGGIEKQAVLIKDDSSDITYLPVQHPPALIIYAKNSGGEKLRAKGINSQNTNAVKLWLESQDVSPGTTRSLRLEFIGAFNASDYATRNLTLRQDPNNPNADPNLYDILDLTLWGTLTAYIGLPPITTPGSEENWTTRSDNYADFFMSTPNGKVNFKDYSHMAKFWGRTDCGPENNWCKYSDLNRDGKVNGIDLNNFRNEWLYDSNDPNTYSSKATVPIPNKIRNKIGSSIQNHIYAGNPQFARAPIEDKLKVLKRNRRASNRRHRARS
jgi:hypothetical protein